MAEEDRKKKGEDEEEGEGQPAPAPKSNKLLIIAISAAVLLLVIAVSLIVYFSMKEKSAEIVPNNLVTAGQEAVPEGAADEEEELGDDEKPLGIIFPLETFMVNLTGEKRYLRCQIQIEFDKKEIPRKFYTQLVPIKDALVELLAQQDPKELANQKGRNELKERVRELINERLRREDVRTVYFTQFLIQ